MKVMGLNPAAVYSPLGLCATGVLRPACNLVQLGAVIAVSLLRHQLSRRVMPQTERVIKPSHFNHQFFINNCCLVTQSYSNLDEHCSEFG